jgi:hypothetical protein
MSSGKSYDQPLVISYTFGGLVGVGIDFGTGGLVDEIPVPVGKTRCRIESVDLNQVSEAGVGTTTTPRIQLGDGSDDDRYCDMDILNTAIGASATIKASELFDIGHGGAGIIDIGEEGITELILTCVVGTGGTPAGIGHVTVTIGWW